MSDLTTRPPWLKKHDVRLKSPSAYDFLADQSRGGNDTSRHRPLKYTGWDGGRKAGTYGRLDAASLHPDDVDHGSDEQPDALSAGRKTWERTREDVERKGGVDAMLKDDASVLSVRDVKTAVPNFKLLDPQHHAFARFVLPISEAAIKSQEWPGKEHEDGGKKNDDKQDEQSSKKEKEPDKEPDTDNKKGKEGGHDDSNKPDPAMERFIAALSAELRASKSLRNNPGTITEPLKLLEGDFLVQLEGTVSVEDQSTPDSWVPRSAHLLRLTGAHPLNAEPALSKLFAAGMVTPTKLHYVRSHGAVPALDWNTHTLIITVFISVDGNEKTTEWSMDDLAYGQFAISEFPVTFACDGNRRKEINMVKRSAAFNWSAAGVSTCMWRGVHIRDVLLASGLMEEPEIERWYLNFEGADEPSEGPYATSIPLAYAMDPANDVMLVFGQNGRVLHPDHGYPLRTIIPGMVGGRQVKWLKKLWITKKPNDSHYHIWDNKVVPSFIDSKQHPLANLFFHHEDTAVYDGVTADHILY